MKPFTSDRKRTPSSTALASLSAPCGVAELLQMVKLDASAVVTDEVADATTTSTIVNSQRPIFVDTKPHLILTLDELTSPTSTWVDCVARVRPDFLPLRRVDRLIRAWRDLKDRVFDSFDRLRGESNRTAAEREARQPPCSHGGRQHDLETVGAGPHGDTKRQCRPIPGDRLER